MSRLEMEGEDTIYVYSRRYIGYEDYIKNSTHHVMTYRDVLPRKVFDKVSKIYYKAMEIVVERFNVAVSDVDRVELFDIALRVFRGIERIRKCTRSGDLDVYAAITAYIYMYMRGVRMKLVGRGVRSLALKVMASEFNGDAIRRRFVKSSIERIANGDFLLYRILATSIAWLGKRMNTNPSSLIACACRIAMLYNPVRYPFNELRRRFKDARINYQYIESMLERLNIHVLERTGYGMPTKVVFPADLCIEFERMEISVPSHISCR